jgi:hypothetical protein
MRKSTILDCPTIFENYPNRFSTKFLYYWVVSTTKRRSFLKNHYFWKSEVKNEFFEPPLCLHHLGFFCQNSNGIMFRGQKFRRNGFFYQILPQISTYFDDAIPTIKSVCTSIFRAHLKKMGSTEIVMSSVCLSVRYFSADIGPRELIFWT